MNLLLLLLLLWYCNIAPQVLSEMLLASQLYMQSKAAEPQQKASAAVAAAAASLLQGRALSAVRDDAREPAAAKHSSAEPAVDAAFAAAAPVFLRT
jgi:hypothetical protein